MPSDNELSRGMNEREGDPADAASVSQAGHWSALPLRMSVYGDSDALAGSFVHNRVALSRQVPDGVYKFVVDSEGHMWIGLSSDDIAHSALVPRGEPVRIAGYIAIRNGLANLNFRSGHYMAHQPVRREDYDVYTRAIRETLVQASIDIGKIELGGGPVPIRMPS